MLGKWGSRLQKSWKSKEAELARKQTWTLNGWKVPEEAVRGGGAGGELFQGERMGPKRASLRIGRHKHKGPGAQTPHPPAAALPGDPLPQASRFSSKNNSYRTVRSKWEELPFYSCHLPPLAQVPKKPVSTPKFSIKDNRPPSSSSEAQGARQVPTGLLLDPPLHPESFPSSLSLRLPPPGRQPGAPSLQGPGLHKALFPKSQSGSTLPPLAPPLPQAPALSWTLPGPENLRDHCSCGTSFPLDRPCKQTT